MRYTKHKIIRVRHLNNVLSEIVFERKSLNYKPGSLVELYGLENRHLLSIASATGAPWCRLILELRKHEELVTLSPHNGGAVKISEVHPVFENLYLDKDPGFIVKGAGISHLLSYVSTFPDRKVEAIVLDEDIIHERFLEEHHILKREISDLNENKTYYVAGLNKEEKLPLGHLKSLEIA